MIELIGAVYAVVMFIAVFPLVWVIFKNRNNPEALRGISVLSLLLFTLGCTLGVIYGIMLGGTFLVVSSLVTGVLEFVSVIIILRSRFGKAVSVDIVNENIISGSLVDFSEVRTQAIYDYYRGGLKALDSNSHLTEVSKEFMESSLESGEFDRERFVIIGKSSYYMIDFVDNSLEKE